MTAAIQPRLPLDRPEPPAPPLALEPTTWGYRLPGSLPPVAPDPRSVACLRCGASRGERCARPSGQPTTTGSHMERIASIRAAIAATDTRQGELYLRASTPAR